MRKANWPRGMQYLSKFGDRTRFDLGRRRSILRLPFCRRADELTVKVEEAWKESWKGRRIRNFLRAYEIAMGFGLILLTMFCCGLFAFVVMTFPVSIRGLPSWDGRFGNIACKPVPRIPSLVTSLPAWGSMFGEVRCSRHSPHQLQLAVIKFSEESVCAERMKPGEEPGDLCLSLRNPPNTSR